MKKKKDLGALAQIEIKFLMLIFLSYLHKQHFIHIFLKVIPLKINNKLEHT